jgi:hypothetical protein
LEPPITSSTKSDKADTRKETLETQITLEDFLNLRLELPRGMPGVESVGNVQLPEDESMRSEQPSSVDQPITESQEINGASSAVEHTQIVCSDAASGDDVEVTDKSGVVREGEDGDMEGADEDLHHESLQELSGSISKLVANPPCSSFSRMPYSVVSAHSIPPDVDEYYFELEILEDFGKR